MQYCIWFKKFSIVFNFCSPGQLSFNKVDKLSFVTWANKTRVVDLCDMYPNILLSLTRASHGKVGAMPKRGYLLT